VGNCLLEHFIGELSFTFLKTPFKPGKSGLRERQDGLANCWFCEDVFQYLTDMPFLSYARVFPWWRAGVHANIDAV
jgi:hypothetical protein